MSTRKLPPLGKRQIAFLTSFYRVGMIMLTGSDNDPVIRSLKRRGLIAPPWDANGEGGGLVITPDGLRAIADALDAGWIDRPKREDFKHRA